jgi:hypothetical protein
MKKLIRFENFNLDFCPSFKNYQIPLYLSFIAEIGKKYSVTYNNKLMNIKILSRQSGHRGFINWTQVLEYPAKKVIKNK